MWNTGVIVFLGNWMVLSPFLFPSALEQAWNNRIVGILTIILGIATARAFRWEVAVAVGVAVWLFASSFVTPLLVDIGRLWNDIVVGVMMIIMGARATMKTRARVAPHLPS
jgi:SPW repeat